MSSLAAFEIMRVDVRRRVHDVQIVVWSSEFFFGDKSPSLSE